MAIRVIGLFIMGMVVAIVVALSQVNLETLRGSILSIMQNTTGMPVEINGEVSWKFSLRPQIEFHQVRIPNAEWAKHEYAFSAEKVSVNVNLISLLRGRVAIQNVRIDDATLCVEQNADGMYSINQISTYAKNAVDTSGAGVQNVAPSKYLFPDLSLGGIEVRNMVAHILDSSYSLTGINVRQIPRAGEREYSGWIKPREKVYPFILSFSEYNSERKIYPVRIAFANGGDDALIANIALEGTSKMPIDFIVRGDVPDVTAVEQIFNLNLKHVPAMKVNIAGGFDNNKITLRKSTITSGDNKMTLSGDLTWGHGTPMLNLNASSESINLVKLFPHVYGRKRVRPNRELNVFKNVPLFGGFWRSFDMNLNAKIKHLIVFRDLDIADIDMKIMSDDGVARIDVNTNVGGGDITIGGDVNIDDENRLYVHMGAVGKEIVVGKILEQVHANNLISDLPSDFVMYVQANGRDLSELMQTLTGPVQIFSSGSGYAHERLVANVYGTDFLTDLRHGVEDLFRSEKKHNQMKISCVSLNAKLRNGVFETRQGFAIETNAINLRMAGNLDLGGESMKLSLTTVPVRGLKLSLGGNVMNSVELTGSLAEPDIKISGAALAGKVAASTGLGLLLAPLTGGLSLVATAGVGLVAGDLLENWLADTTPCRTAIERGAPDRFDDPEWMAMPAADLASEIINNQNRI